MELDTALKNFADAFAAGPENSGVVQWRTPEPIAEPMPLGPIVKAYYARMRLGGRPMVGGALILDLIDLDDLETIQHEWGWMRDKSGQEVVDPSWNKDRIIIAYRHGDAVSVDGGTAGGVVHGHIGAYSCKIADDLASFFQAMAEAMVVEATTYDYDVCDDDCGKLPAFLDDMRAIARRVLGPAGEAGFMEFFFG
ncbi:hypothetical protein [Massilia sp. CCM 8734]|uniref:hypothetical protein n=1 Tax=Massilia sp. CCM 8734 TaxID=2609283 RepID=UPI001420D25D|nr:hypothetical protein [Massilia sp. CCM 8734]NHZ97368.1 hypothetical protein [Massilia sp. CCM 8734]